MARFQSACLVKDLEASRQFHEKFGFSDVRELQRQLKAQGVLMVNEADESTTGPASFVAVDPDGYPILVDQHVSVGAPGLVS